MIESLLSFFTIAGVFYTVLLIGIVLAFACVENENWFWATVLHVGVVWYAIEYWNIMFTLSNVLVLVACYFLMGTVNSVLQWWLLLKDSKKVYNASLTSKDVIELLLRGQSITDPSQMSDNTPITIHDNRMAIRHELEVIAYDIANSRSKRITRTLNKNLSNETHTNKPYKSAFIPNVESNREWFYGWIAFWPTLFVWNVISNPVKAISVFIYNRCGKLYSKIAESVFA